MRTLSAFLLGIILLIVLSCGKANSSDRAKAERVFTDQAGYTCFIIRDESGQAVGGNCLKD